MAKVRSNKITPFLWFEKDAEAAMKFYAKVFPNSRILGVNKMPDGTVLGGEMVLAGQRVMTLNGGPQFKPNEAFSFYVRCKDQKEVDKYWKKLTAKGGEESMCGWLKDKYGVSWQIIPDALPDLLFHKDPAKAGRAMQAMLKMRKIDVQKLKEAAKG